MATSTKKKPRGNTPARAFRLQEEVMQRLDRIANYLTRTTGIRHSRADAIRVLSKEKDDSIRRLRCIPRYT